MGQGISRQLWCYSLLQYLTLVIYKACHYCLDRKWCLYFKWYDLLGVKGIFLYSMVMESSLKLWTAEFKGHPQLFLSSQFLNVSWEPFCSNYVLCTSFWPFYPFCQSVIGSHLTPMQLLQLSKLSLFQDVKPLFLGFSNSIRVGHPCSIVVAMTKLSRTFL